MTGSPLSFVFAPVPIRARHDGWTAERQRGFIAALRETRSAKHAARAVGMSREGAYALLRRPGAAGFAAAWDAALNVRLPAPRPSPAMARARIFTKIMDRAAALVSS